MTTMTDKQQNPLTKFDMMIISKIQDQYAGYMISLSKRARKFSMNCSIHINFYLAHALPRFLLKVVCRLRWPRNFYMSSANHLVFCNKAAQAWTSWNPQCCYTGGGPKTNLASQTCLEWIPFLHVVWLNVWLISEYIKSDTVNTTLWNMLWPCAVHIQKIKVWKLKS